MATMTSPPTRHDYGPAAQEQQQLREHERFAAAQDPVALAAAGWFARRGNLDAQQQQQFGAWLAEPRHADAYAAVQDAYRQARQIPPGIAARWRVPPPPVAAPTPAARRHWLRSARWAVAAMLVLAVGGGAYQWRQQQAIFTQAYASARGERLAIDLPDGSRVQLDTGTRIEVALYRQRRSVRLLQGEAMFAVRSRKDQLFEVASGPLRVTVVGTQFAVRNTVEHDGLLRVAVQHGHVRVAGAGPAVVNLTANQGVTADAGGRLSSVASLAPGSVAPWREGRITFDNVPLGQALAEIERYGDTGLVVRDPAVARLRIGGSFTLGRQDGFASALPQLLPVQLVQQGTRREIRLKTK